MIILNFLFQAIKIILMLSILVIIHELGHFTVAKLFKIPVKEFSVGFGKKLFSKDIKGTTYSIRLFFLGGYVDIDDESREGSFSNAPLYQKNLILFAGVFVNFVFAFIFGIIVLFSQGNFTSNEIETLNENAPIYSSGIQIGDEIYKINGKRIKTKNQIDTVMSTIQNNSSNINIDVKRNNEIIKYNIKPYEYVYPSTGFMVNEKNEIIKINKNSDADKAGVEINDKITLIDDNTVNTNGDMLTYLLNSSDDVVNISFIRNGQLINKDVKFEKNTVYYIGVTLKDIENTFSNKFKYSFIGIGDFFYETFRGIVLLITGQNKNAELMGIVGVSSIITKTTNMVEYLSIMVSISLSLAIVNLFPLPILDGGKIVLFTIEKYRKKEFSEKFVSIISTATIVLLIILTIYVMIGDILRIV